MARAISFEARCGKYRARSAHGTSQSFNTREDAEHWLDEMEAAPVECLREAAEAGAAARKGLGKKGDVLGF